MILARCLLASALLPLLAASATAAETRATWPCRSEVTRLLERWKSPLAASGLDPSARIYASAGAPPGELVRVSWADGAPVVERVGTRTVARLRYEAPGCGFDYTVEALPERAVDRGAAFRDADLAELLRRSAERHSSTLLYLWSPRMNYSIRGAKEAAEAAKSAGAELVVLADPDVPDAELSAVITSQGLPAADARRDLSRDLEARFGRRHYPSILVVSDGVLRGLATPGYVSPARLAAIVRGRTGAR